MKQRIQILKALAHKFEHEIKHIAQDLHKLNLSPTSKETIIEDTASMNGILRTMKESIESIELCCNEENLDLNDMEKKYIGMALERNNGHLGNSAKYLGISSRTMTRRMSELKINRAKYKSILPKQIKKCDTLAHCGR